MRQALKPQAPVAFRDKDTQIGKKPKQPSQSLPFVLTLAAQTCAFMFLYLSYLNKANIQSEPDLLIFAGIVSKLWNWTQISLR